ncbi:MAG: D-alanyl-D-alanine carboxypeptidase/D-alanyl-D-alanine-endopeptidase [Verrucomicrobiales bacterium]
MQKKRTQPRSPLIPHWLANTGQITGWGLAIGLGILHLNQETPEIPAPEPEPTEPLGLYSPLPLVTSPQFTELERLLREITQEEGMVGSTLVSCILDSTGKVVFSFDGDRSFVPASALKTVTTATILEKLGPDFRYRTLLQGTAPFPSPDKPSADGIYKGDLVIVGGGDPSLTTEDLIQWGADLAALGIQEIDGRVIADGKIFPELTAAKAWDWGDVGNYYGAPATGLNIDGNRYAATFQPGAKVGDPAKLIEVVPEVPAVEIFNRMLTSEPNRAEGDAPYAYGGPYSYTITFRGAIPIDAKEEVLMGAVPDPVFTASTRLHKILSQRGIKISGKPTTVRMLEQDNSPVPSAEKLLPGLSHTSAPLIDLINHTHKVSDNLYAECFFRLLALEPEVGSGQAAIESHWKKRGLTLQGLRMEDGSGLARADVIRATDLARINFLTRRGPFGEAFYNSLTPQFEGKMRWKGGAMSRVRVYVGFTVSTTEELTFVLAFNNYDANSVTVAKARERILKVLSEF